MAGFTNPQPKLWPTLTVSNPEWKNAGIESKQRKFGLGIKVKHVYFPFRGAYS